VGVEDKIKEHCNKQQKGVKFYRNKKYFSLLRKVKEGYWVNDEPLFINKTQGLYPVFKTGGPQGKFPKNHQEFILRNLVQEEEKWNI
jgi:hypothetical protein